MKKILIVEDEEHIANGLRFNIEAEGHEAFVAADGERALDMMGRTRFDAIVLDIMLPGINGFEVASRIREQEDYTPILMLTARGQPGDVLKGFEAGTDDYLPKPFDLDIFLARLNGVLRRSSWLSKEARLTAVSVININGREIDFDNLELKADDETVHLTLMEAKLLRYLIDHEGRAVSRKTILNDVWGLQEDTDTRAIDNFIVRLRRHLEDAPNDPQILQTVRGVGYKFVRPSE